MPFHQIFDLKSDGRYLQGLEQGRKQGLEQSRKLGRELANREFALTLLKETDFDNDKIASLTNVSVDFVSGLRAGLNGNSSKKNGAKN